MAAVYESLALAGRFDDAQGDVWARIARGYAAFTSPFVPRPEDIASFERAVAIQADLHGGAGLKAVILGVTPALALMKWPQGSQIEAVEISQAVIDAIWPGDIPGTRRARCASWLAIPLQRKSCDVVVGDGSLATCRFPGEVRNLVRSAHDLLVDDGLFAFRSYIRPQVQESVEAVFEALFSASGLSVDRFTMRLYLAMQRSVEEGVAVREAARLLDRYHLDRRTMKERLGWSSAAIEPFAAWRASDAVYSFPTLDELRGVVGEYFDAISIAYPRYELGHCCPTLAMRPRAAGKGACASSLSKQRL